MNIRQWLMAALLLSLVVVSLSCAHSRQEIETQEYVIGEEFIVE